jgi:hypothetical protein
MCQFAVSKSWASILIVEDRQSYKYHFDFILFLSINSSPPPHTVALSHLI